MCNARGVYGGDKVNRSVGGKGQIDAHTGLRGQGDTAARFHDCAGTRRHQGVRLVLQHKQSTHVRLGHRKESHYHVRIGVRATNCLRHPHVAVVGRVEGAAPLKLVLEVGGSAGLVVTTGDDKVRGLNYGAILAVDSRALTELCFVPALDRTLEALALPHVHKLLLVARERVVAAVVVVRLKNEERLLARLDAVCVRLYLAVLIGLCDGLIGCRFVKVSDVFHQVVNVALKLGRDVRGEESGVRDARRVDGGEEVDRSVGGKGQGDAHPGRGGLGDVAARFHLRAGARRQHGVRRGPNREKIRGRRLGRRKENHLHCRVGVCIGNRLRHPLVAVVRRLEDAAPLKLIVPSLKARVTLQDEGRITNGLSVATVDYKWVVRLVLLTPAQLTIMGMG
mmetsp:Transcript_7033/g.11808  ORF Transcript_7033/g.11808 Transcript_7033/m.11808 type:complete len:394 (+) Transcript_7033:969-2150(+)